MYRFEKIFNKTIKIILTNATEILTCEFVKSPYDLINLAELYELINDYEVKPDFITFTVTIQLKQVKTLKFSAVYKKEEKKIVLDFFNPTYLENEIVLLFTKNKFIISKKINQTDSVYKFIENQANEFSFRSDNIIKVNDCFSYKGTIFYLSSLGIFANYLLCDIYSKNYFEINGIKINAFMNPVSRVLKGNFVEIKFLGIIDEIESENSVSIRIYGYY